MIITHVELLKKLMRRVYPFEQLWIDLWGIWTAGPHAGEKVVKRFPLEAVLNDDKVNWYHPIVAEAGSLGVTFFFVLSGFLISYLLFVEREKTGRIGIRKFYYRRILRIWPLYFLVVFIGFFVLPYVDYFYVPYQSFITEPHRTGDFWGAFVLFLFMLPNLALAVFGPFPNIGQSWSIGVEEQFYLIWPWILRKAKHPFRSMAYFFTGYIGVKGSLLIWSVLDPSRDLSVLTTFFAMSKLECMAIGGMGAYLLYRHRDGLVRIVFHPLAQAAAWLGIPLLLYLTPSLVEDLAHIMYALCFLVIILNVSSNAGSWVKLEHPVLHFLGKISYGLYMYHMMVIIFVLHVFTKLVAPETPQTWWMHGLIYLSVLVITVLVSYLSYTLFESRFIGLKSKFAEIKSGDSAKP